MCVHYLFMRFYDRKCVCDDRERVRDDRERVIDDREHTVFV